MRADTPKVNQHVTYVGADKRLRPATIVAAAGDTLDLRVGHHSETYTGIAKEAAATDVDVWRKTDAFQGGS